MIQNNIERLSFINSFFPSIKLIYIMTSIETFSPTLSPTLSINEHTEFDYLLLLLTGLIVPIIICLYNNPPKKCKRENKEPEHEPEHEDGV